jgi:hypothetical protein
MITRLPETNLSNRRSTSSDEIKFLFIKNHHSIAYAGYIADAMVVQ